MLFKFRIIKICGTKCCYRIITIILEKYNKYIKEKKRKKTTCIRFNVKKLSNKFKHQSVSVKTHSADKASRNILEINLQTDVNSV